MADFDISPLRQIPPEILENNPQMQMALMPIFAAAAADGTPGGENTLTEDEVRRFVQDTRGRMQQTQSLLTRSREALVGSLENALGRIRQEGLSSEDLQRVEGLLTHAASQDDADDQLSAEELRSTIQFLQQSMSELSEENFRGQVQQALTLMEQLETQAASDMAAVEAVPPSEPIDLNFLKQLPITVLQGNEDLAMLLDLAGIDPQNQRGDWSLTFPEVQAAFSQIPETERQGAPNAEALMTQMRLLARMSERQVTQDLAQIQQDALEIPPEGVPLQVLIEHREQLRDNPRVEYLIQAAGEDGRFSLEDAQAAIARAQARNPEFQQDPQVLLAGAARLVAETTARFAEESPDAEAEAPPQPPLDPDMLRSMRVLYDLERRRVGVTHRDLQELEENAWPNFLHFVTWACTLGGLATAWIDNPRIRETDILPTMGPTYLHYAREAVEAHDHRRGEYIRELANLLGLPCPHGTRSDDGTVEFDELPERTGSPNPHFLRWLETRPEGERGVNIHNALEYMRVYPQFFETIVERIFTADPSHEDLRRYLEDLHSEDPTRRGNIPEEMVDYVEFYADMRREEESHDAFRARMGLEGENRSDSRIRSYLYQYNMETPHHYDEAYERLTSHLFEADQLWELHSMEDRDDQERQWLAFADYIERRTGSSLEMLFGHFSPVGYGTTNSLFTRDIDTARATRRSLIVQTEDRDFRLEVRQAQQDSMGQNIRDAQGHVIEEGNGELGLWPVDWFRNYPTEAVDGAVSDLTVLAASWEMGGWAFRGLKGVFGAIFTSGGRYRLMQGLLRFLGLRMTGPAPVEGAAAATRGTGARLLRWMTGRGTTAAELEAAEAMSGAAAREATQVLPPTMLENLERRIAARAAQVTQAEVRVAEATARLEQAQALAGSNTARIATLQTELTVAQRQLSRAQFWQRMLESPWYRRYIERATGMQLFWRRAVPLHPPIPEALRSSAAQAGRGGFVDWAFRTSAYQPGTGGIRARLARMSVRTLENISLRGVGRGLRFLSYDGWIIAGIAGYAFSTLPRHGRDPAAPDIPSETGPTGAGQDPVELFDREYRIPLVVEEEEEEE